MNKIIITGHVVKDVEIFTTQSNKRVSTFSMGVNRPFSKEKKSDFFNVQCWEKLAEISSNLKKGDKITVAGYMQNRDYIDKKTNEKKYVWEVVASDLEFFISKESK